MEFGLRFFAISDFLFHLAFRFLVFIQFWIHYWFLRGCRFRLKFVARILKELSFFEMAYLLKTYAIIPRPWGK